MLQLCRIPGDERVCCGQLTRAVLRRGRDLVSPRDAIAESLDAKAMEALPVATDSDELAALKRLEQALS